MCGGIEKRADAIRAKPSELKAAVRLYSTEEGGVHQTKLPGWGCLCCETKTSFKVGQDGISRLFGYDGWPQLEQPLAPGERCLVGFVFLAGNEAADALRKSGTFFLWEGRFIGEATVIA